MCSMGFDKQGRTFAGVLTALFLLVMSAPALAVESKPAPWRGSTFSYRNAASAISLDKGAELSYNPYYVMSFEFAPRWWFGKYAYVSADADLSRELTDADDTTREGEWWWGDVRVGAGGTAPRIPVVGLIFSAKVDVIAPTSKVAQARTMILGVRPQVSVARTFKVLSGISLAYAFQATRFFNEYTTSQRKVPLIPGCTGGASCARFSNLGLRNTEWRLTNAASVGIDFTSWLGLSADFALIVDTLYDMAEDDRVSFEPQGGTNKRYLMAYSAEVWGKPMPSLGLALGFSTVNPQLKPDSSYEDPFINRYTTVYLDLRFHIDGFISQLRSL
jgi:hypothetical protein